MLRPALVTVLLCFCATTLAASPAPDAQEILRFERDACDAYLHSDAARLEQMLTDDFVFTNGQAEMNDKNAELAEIRAKAIRFTAFENREMVVRQHGDQAVVTGITLVEGAPVATGKPFSIQVRFTDTLARIDGKWRLLAGHVSRIPKTEN